MNDWRCQLASPTQSWRITFSFSYFFLKKIASAKIILFRKVKINSLRQRNKQTSHRSHQSLCLCQSSTKDSTSNRIVRNPLKSFNKTINNTLIQLRTLRSLEDARLCKETGPQICQEPYLWWICYHHPHVIVILRSARLCLIYIPPITIVIAILNIKTQNWLNKVRNWQ